MRGMATPDLVNSLTELNKIVTKKPPTIHLELGPIYPR